MASIAGTLGTCRAKKMTIRQFRGMRSDWLHMDDSTFFSEIGFTVRGNGPMPASTEKRQTNRAMDAMDSQVILKTMVTLTSL